MKQYVLQISILALVLGISACTKKRAESFVQGQGRDLMTIADFDGKEFAAETLDPIDGYSENPVLSKSAKVIQNEKSKVPEIKAVKVKTDADLLYDAPFVAVPKTTSDYKIRYRITQDYLVLLKIAKKSMVHPQEIPGAIPGEEKLDKDVVAIPLVGYPIRGFYNVENVDVNGSKSDKLIEIPAKDKGSARYFKIDKNDRVVYKHLEKLDVFSKEYFLGPKGDSQWFFAQTIIGASAKNAKYVGRKMVDSDAELNSLNKIKFDLTRNEMLAVSVNLDKRLNINDAVNQTVLVRIPMDWKEYRATPSGTNSFRMTEEENSSAETEKRNYVKLDFARSNTISISSPNFQFVDLELDENYFSYTLLETEANVRIKHSFLRDAGRAKYTPKRAFKEDMETFGFFTTQKHEIKNYEKYKQEDFGKNIFINRFNTAQDKIVFYITEGSEKSLIPTAVKAVEAWDRAFQAAGLKVRIVADTTKFVRLGDLRYNQINIVDSKTESSLLGYGPSITDPTTGEIISATTNMHVVSIKAILVDFIREYIRHRAKETTSLTIPIPPPADSDDVPLAQGKVMVSEDNSRILKLIKKLPVLGANGTLEMKELEVKPKKENEKFHFQKNFGREFDLSLTSKYLIKDVERDCPELKDVKVSAEKQLDNTASNELILKCADKLLPGKMLGTVLHEMGHNFGLRHNFYGSVDSKHFHDASVTGTEDKVNSSSVMEYPSFNEDRLNVVGKYDIAAIRFGYADSIESSDGKISKLNTSLSIADNVKESKVTLMPYMFCTDEDTIVGTDPMCNQNDAGTTPDQVVESMINEYNTTIPDFNYRLGRQRKISPQKLTTYRLNRFWIPFKQMYDEYRFRLADHLGSGNEFLESFDAARLKSAIEEKTSKCILGKDKDEKEIVLGDAQSSDCQLLFYERAAKRIFNFANQLASLPPKYCIGKKGASSSIAAVEFADVRRTIMNVNKVVPKSCMDPLVKDYILAKYKFTPTDESGYELEDVRLDMKVKMSDVTDFWGNPIPEPPDIIGLMPEKMIAMEVIAARASLSMSSDDKPFKPNFLDEPVFRERVLSYVADRISKGIPAPKLLRNELLTGNEGKFIEKFKYEKKYIDNMVYAVFNGLDVPDKTLATKQRKKKFLVKYTDKKDILDKAKFKVPGSDGTTYYAIMSEDNSEAKKLLQMLETLPKRLEAASPLTEKTFDSLLEIIDNQLGKEDSMDWLKLVEFLHAVIEDEFNETACQTKPTPRSKEKIEIDKHRVHWKKLFGIELASYRPYLQNLYMPGSGEAADVPGACATNFNVWYQVISEKVMAELKAKEPNYNLNKKVIVARIDEYKKKAAEKAKAPQANEEEGTSYEELSTQLDLIMSVLRNMTDW